MSDRFCNSMKIISMFLRLSCFTVIETVTIVLQSDIIDRWRLLVGIDSQVITVIIIKVRTFHEHERSSSRQNTEENSIEGENDSPDAKAVLSFVPCFYFFFFRCKLTANPYNLKTVFAREKRWYEFSSRHHSIRNNVPRWRSSNSAGGSRSCDKSNARLVVNSA